MSKKDKITELNNSLIKGTGSPLLKYRNENNYVPVMGGGSLDAKIMFIGEAPGKNEAVKGIPFCGSAGKILDLLLSEAKLVRDEVYITSIVKDRPPKNRDPLPEEINYYSPYLDSQIDIIQPRIIALLGRYAMIYVMNKFGLLDSIKPISELHGKSFNVFTDYGEVKLIALYHPAAAIYNRSKLPILIDDYKKITE